MVGLYVLDLDRSSALYIVTVTTLEEAEITPVKILTIKYAGTVIWIQKQKWLKIPIGASRKPYAIVFRGGDDGRGAS